MRRRSGSCAWQAAAAAAPDAFRNASAEALRPGADPDLGATGRCRVEASAQRPFMHGAALSRDERRKCETFLSFVKAASVSSLSATYERGAVIHQRKRYAMLAPYQLPILPLQV